MSLSKHTLLTLLDLVDHRLDTLRGDRAANDAMIAEFEACRHELMDMAENYEAFSGKVVRFPQAVRAW